MDNNAKKNEELNQQPPETGPLDDMRLQVVRPASPFDGSAGRQQQPQGTGTDLSAQAPPIVHGQAGQQNHAPRQFDEELSTFFRDRRVVMKSHFDVMPILATFAKLIVIMLVACALFLFFWNYSSSLRVKIQAMGLEHLNTNLAQELPSWTRKARQFKAQNTIELGEFHARNGRPNENVSIISTDPVLASIPRGYWQTLEKTVVQQCGQWQISRDCSLKAWFLSYKGLRATLKPISSFDLALVGKLPKMEQSLMLYAMSQTVIGQRSDELFDRALEVASHDTGLKRAMIDAKIKSIVRDGQQFALPRVMAQAQKTEATQSELSKWSALESVAKFKVRAIGSDKTLDGVVRKQLGDFVRRHAAHLRGDPVALIILAPPMLRLGMGQELASVAEAIASQENPRQFDPNLYREISVFAMRAHMLRGQLAESMERAKSLQSRLGPDATSSHLLGSTLLATRNASTAQQAVIAFQKALAGQKFWESKVGYFLSLTRSRRLAEAEAMMGDLRKSMTPSNSTWIKLALAEFKLTKARSSVHTTKKYFGQLANELAPMYAANPTWPTLSDLYANALYGAGNVDLARKIQAAADQQSDRVRFVGSSEFLLSPFGPYALMR